MLINVFAFCASTCGNGSNGFTVGIIFNQFFAFRWSQMTFENSLNSFDSHFIIYFKLVLHRHHVFSWVSKLSGDNHDRQEQAQICSLIDGGSRPPLNDFAIIQFSIINYSSFSIQMYFFASIIFCNGGNMTFNNC